MSTFSATLEATLTCPECGGLSRETMPQDCCLYFYDCRSCGALLKPLAGDCCVFCSYADQPCPPVQQARAAGRDGRCCG